MKEFTPPKRHWRESNESFAVRKEIAALKFTAETLLRFDYATRQRILNYLVDRFVNNPPAGEA